MWAAELVSDLAELQSETLPDRGRAKMERNKKLDMAGFINVPHCSFYSWVERESKFSFYSGVGSLWGRSV